MPRKFEKPTGRVTLRVPPEMHGQMAEVADALGTDINGLVGMILRDGLPAYVEKAARVRVLHDQANKLWDEKKIDTLATMVGPDHPLGPMWAAVAHLNGESIERIASRHAVDVETAKAMVAKGEPELRKMTEAKASRKKK